jgi:hypothetical protein
MTLDITTLRKLTQFNDIQYEGTVQKDILLMIHGKMTLGITTLGKRHSA